LVRVVRLSLVERLTQWFGSTNVNAVLLVRWLSHRSIHSGWLLEDVRSQPGRLELAVGLNHSLAFLMMTHSVVLFGLNYCLLAVSLPSALSLPVRSNFSTLLFFLLREKVLEHFQSVAVEADHAQNKEGSDEFHVAFVVLWLFLLVLLLLSFSVEQVSILLSFSHCIFHFSEESLELRLRFLFSFLVAVVNSLWKLSSVIKSPASWLNCSAVAPCASSISVTRRS